MPFLLEIFLLFFKIGALCFGGGYAMIPVISDEVLTRGWLTQSELLNFIAISESTPGPIAINVATLVGSFQGQVVYGSVIGRFLGSLMATLGVVTPAFIIILLVASVVNGLLKFAGVQSFLKGVRPVVVGLIISTGISMFLTVVLNFSSIGGSINFSWKALAVFAINIAVHLVYKKIKKQSISPIILIIISALLGLLFYGIL